MVAVGAKVPVNPFAEHGVARDMSRRQHGLPRYVPPPSSKNVTKSWGLRLIYQVCILLVFGLSCISLISVFIPDNEIKSKLKILTQLDQEGTNGNNGMVGRQWRLRAALEAARVGDTTGVDIGSGSSARAVDDARKGGDDQEEEDEDGGSTAKKNGPSTSGQINADRRSVEDHEDAAINHDELRQIAPQKFITDAKEIVTEEVKIEAKVAASKGNAFGRDAPETDTTTTSQQGIKSTFDERPDAEIIVKGNQTWYDKLSEAYKVNATKNLGSTAEVQVVDRIGAHRPNSTDSSVKTESEHQQQQGKEQQSPSDSAKQSHTPNVNENNITNTER